ncbi:L,D-transpeptidase family protein [Methylosinus sporium]|uniref:L,D-transpeptidase family protein n=1 Tax=Methylosinus sporium TaxID=428 RepID=A0A549SHM9_METSR|nr:L,D-transpeptidase family protein [Methylosinus sporium]TRL29092.1 L,D-transpeptidase family protein [Methylosinus sporium]
MVFRGSFARASILAFAVGLGSSFVVAHGADAAPRAPFRGPLAVAPPPLVQQLEVSRPPIGEPPAELFPPPRTSALLPIANSVSIVLPPAAGGFDVAEALIGEAQRAFADALDAWESAARGSEQRARRKAIVAFYAQRVYAPLWREGDSWRASAPAAIERLSRARDDGLDLRGLAYPSETKLGGDADEFALSEAVVAYAIQASGGRVDPRRLSRLISAHPALPEPGAALATIAAAGSRAGDRLQDYNPPHEGYRALRAKLVELRSAGLPELDRRFAAASHSLARDADPRAQAPSAPPRRSNAQVEAEIIANMERWRWLPRELGESRIEVNIPDFELAVVRDGQVAHRARVIVGKEGTPTPVFSDKMQFIIVNPYWNVPPSILTKEMLPKFGGDLSAIAARGYEVITRKGQTFVRQKPGEANALGRIKFMFPNDFSVYLHDTPNHGLFTSAHRALSHGCVRVDQPFRLAEAVLGPGSGWPEERVRKLVGSSERYINLARPLPIHIEYFTAFVDENGRLQLRGDLYGYSAKVRQALGLEG